ncbi:MAG: T9SS C-terminal target domain-containing protein [Bacteroidetes bacterium]|nr:MAG: T9SS C-terminal target domain-containing protein [Bacteroidota bacterium]
MKKITMLFSALFLASMAFAGNPEFNSNSSLKSHPAKSEGFNKKINQTSNVGISNAKIRNSSPSINSVPFYTEDFAGGIPNTWQIVDSIVSGVRWGLTTVGAYDRTAAPGSDSLSHSGTTASNGYAKIDSDSSGGSVGGEHSVLISEAINCSAYSNINLNFNEFFLFYQAATPAQPNTAKVYVSNDGTNWTHVHSAHAGLANFEETPNPNRVSVDISAVAGNQATVYLKFSFTGDWSYWWFVDDIQLSEVGATEASLLGIVDPFNGCALSSTQDVTIAVKNVGVDSISNISAAYTVNGIPVGMETITDTIAPGDTLLYTFTTTVDLSTPGLYTILSYINLTGDTDQNNDTAAIGTASVATGMIPYTMGFEAADDLSGWTTFDADGDGRVIDITNVSVRTGLAALRFLFPTTPTNSGDNWVFSNCIDLTSGTTYQLSFWHKYFDVSNAYTVQAYIGTDQNVQSMTLLTNAVPATDTTFYYNTITTFTVPTSGAYYLGIRAFGTTVLSTTRVDDIWLDFNTNVGKTDISNALVVYPNPSSGRIQIENRNSSDQETTVTITNAVGQVVFSNKYDKLVREIVDISTQPEGIYTVQMRTNSGVVTKSIIKSNK